MRPQKLLLAAAISLIGSISAAQTTTSHIVRNSPSPQTAGGFGTYGKELQDFDKDGYPDYAVAAPVYPYGGYVGRVYVVSGRTGGFLQTFDGDQKSSQFGRAIADIGDVNNDGQRDLAVGAYDFDSTGKFNNGKVYVFNGKTGAVLWSREGSVTGDNSGYQLEALGSTKSAAPPILAIGEPGYDATNAANAGRIVFRNAATGALIGTAVGKTYNRNLGVVTASYPESGAFYVADAYGGVWLTSSSGSVGLLQGPPAGGNGRPSLSVVKDAAGRLYPVIGRPRANVGSLVNAGSVEVLSGTIPLLRVVGTRKLQGVGLLVGSMRDVDGDGVEEVAYQQSYNAVVAETMIVKLDGTKVAGITFRENGLSIIGSIPDVTGDRRGELLQFLSSGVSLLFEARVYGQGLTLEKVQNNASGFAADFRMALPFNGGLAYVQLYTLARTFPGTPLPAPSPLLPLNIDAFTDAALALANTPFFPGAIGTLSGSGGATSRALFPPDVAAALKNRRLGTATAVFGASSIVVTNPVEIRL